MRRRFGIILVVLLAIGLLVAINALAFVTEDQSQDSEISPNRSTYNSRATGTRALYDFLSESGHKVMRWREVPDKLLSDAGDPIETFVIIGDTRIPVTDEEAESLLAWVELGGRLVIIDRHPEDHLLAHAGNWVVTTEYLNYPGIDSDPANPELMTKDVTPIIAAQPTLLTQNVGSVMPSRFMSAIKFFPESKSAAEPSPTRVGHSADDETDGQEENDATTAAVSPAPVTHLSSAGNGLLVDYAHGAGRIVLLSDPYIVANGGIALKDNLQLAINLLSSTDGVIAFDEYHQGRGITRNAFASYFSGTPVLAIAGQLALVIILIVWTRGRRFARSLPLPHVDRRSSLEFVASMAELQQRARAYDLAIENVYSRTRRVLARYAGMDYNSPRSEIARRVAERSSVDAHQLETLMRQAEDAINGGAISERQSVHLVTRLREIESSLGLRMRSRDVRQAAQHI